MRHAATVMAKGALAMIDRAKAIMAHILDIDAATIDWNDGRLTAEGTNHSFSLVELAEAAAIHELPDDLAGRACGQHHQRNARTGISERLRNLRNGSRS